MPVSGIEERRNVNQREDESIEEFSKRSAGEEVHCINRNSLNYIKKQEVQDDYFGK